jgi:glutamate synthase domain-containing protein 3
MSGGVAYVLDVDGLFARRCNTAMVALEKVLPAGEQKASTPVAMQHRGITDDEQLRALLADHHRWTGSLRARELLDDWESARARFVKVFPHEYKRALGEMAAKREAPAVAAVPAVAAK